MNKKYAVQGIVGCVLFGVGDWLLGFVDPEEVQEDVFYFIKCRSWGWVPGLEDHGDDELRHHRSFISLAGICAYFRSDDRRKRQGRTIGTEQAVMITNGLDKVMNPCIFIAYLIFGIALVDLVIVIARGKTKLKRSDAFITPLTWMLLIGAVSFFLPTSPFSKGLYTFCMNGGMIVWFIRLLIQKNK